MPPRKRQAKTSIEAYNHLGQGRLNNPPVGLVDSYNDQESGKKTYQYDPHIDPQLEWAGKVEGTSFEVATVSLHVHERIDPRTIVEAAKKRNGTEVPIQGSMFEQPDENPPLRTAVEFYQHRHNWSNRLIAGDSLLVMNSLLEKESMGGKVQMVYIDPPYGIRYGSNFQPFVNRRAVRDGRDEDLTQEPETIKAFRDTWELGIHSYLSYLRDRLLLARELITESGSCFVQISDENLHHVRELMDEVFGTENFIGVISFTKASAQSSIFLSSASDFLVWYARDRTQMKYRGLFLDKVPGQSGATNYTNIEAEDGSTWRRMTRDERENPERVPQGWRIFTLDNPYGTRPPNPSDLGPYTFNGRTYNSDRRRCWKTDKDGLDCLSVADRLMQSGNGLYYKRYFDDFSVYPMTTSWTDTASSFMADKTYVVQTTAKTIQRCILMTTDPGDLVLDPTCGSGTTAYVAEQWGRRWITCDTSRVAVTLAKQRLMTALFDYYELAHPDEGVGSGFKYVTVPHVTLGSIANNPDIKEGLSRAEIESAVRRHASREALYDQPTVDPVRKRVSGPFSVEAVPAPAVISPGNADEADPTPADETVGRSGETIRQSDWKDELLKTGIRGKGGQFIRFARLDPLPDRRNLHAQGESLPNHDGIGNEQHRESPEGSQRIVVSFGPEHAPLEQRQVEWAIQEAQTLVPRPRIIVFAAFQFDPEAAKDIDETDWQGVTLLKAQMNPDLLTDDLKKKRTSNESFWLIGQPDVYLRRIAEGPDTGKWKVDVEGFDYYNTRTGNVESGGNDKIAVWSLDTDYDGRSLYPRQVFFPMAGPNDGWSRLARNLKAELDEDLMEAYKGTASLPFAGGNHHRIAVKIVDDRGIESLKVMDLVD